MDASDFHPKPSHFCPPPISQYLQYLNIPILFRHFKTKIFAHVLLLAGCLAGVFAFSDIFSKMENQTATSNLPMAILCGMAGVLILFSLYRLVEKTNREVAQFLLNIRYDDYAATYSDAEKDAAFDNLHGAFNVVTDKFRSIRSQKEAQFQYLQTIVEHVDTGLICFDEKNQTILMNRALQKLLHRSHLHNREMLSRLDPALGEAFDQIQPGERRLVKIISEGDILQLSLRVSVLKMQDATWNLFAVQNIHNELEEQELQSWQKLIRILTHEIMNSATPIVSLAATTSDLLRQPDASEHTDDIQIAVSAIGRRADGLMQFTESYRRLTKVPQPKFQAIEVQPFLENICALVAPVFLEKNVVLEKNWSTKSPNLQINQSPNLQIQADPALLEQVLINLLQNALAATENNPQDHRKVKISFFKNEEGSCVIAVSDNGPGIAPELLEQIFVPFFTTKSEGSGIGLSLCRQIMHLHKGTISVISKPGEGASFLVKI